MEGAEAPFWEVGWKGAKRNVDTPYRKRALHAHPAHPSAQWADEIIVCFIFGGCWGIGNCT